jgi:F1F0 ATPase subunit 2
MTQVFTTEREALTLLLESGAWLTAGGLLGAFHFLSLRRSARMLATASAPAAALALHLIRFAVTAGALSVIARHGAVPLLAATLGVLAARTVVLQAVLGVGETRSGGTAGPRDAAIAVAGMANSPLPRGGVTAAGGSGSPAAPSRPEPAPAETVRITTANQGPRPLP